MAGGGSPDRAAATAPNLQAGATESGGINFGSGRRFTFVPLGPPIPFGAAAPLPGFPPPVPATMFGFHPMDGPDTAGSYFFFGDASQRHGNSTNSGSSNGNGPARGWIPPSPPVVQGPVVLQSVELYCFVCDNADHDMSWCPVLRAPRPSATLCGHGSGESAFLQLPDSVWRPDLAPPTAVVTVTEGKPTAGEVQDIIRSLVPFPSSWKWEALPHGHNAFLVAFPSPEDLQRITSYQLRLKTLGVALNFSEWKGEEAPSSDDLHVVWVHVAGVPHSLRHFLGLWAVGSVVGSTQDVDLLCLRRRGIIRVQVAVLNKEGVFPLAHAVVLENQSYMLHYSLEKEDFEADADFVPKAWDRSDDLM